MSMLSLNLCIHVILLQSIGYMYVLRLLKRCCYVFPMSHMLWTIQ